MINSLTMETFYITPKNPQQSETSDPLPPPPPPLLLTSSPPVKAHKPINGTLKRHHHRQPPPESVPAYKECLKNHAASIGGHALDGCGEFMPSPTATARDPSSLTCAACDCHRNFHRRVAEDPSPPPIMAQPLRSSTTASAPQMLMSLRGGGSPSSPGGGAFEEYRDPTAAARKTKRVRTRFSEEQKEKMYGVSEKLGWRLCKGDEGLVEDFCNQLGIGKGVLKVWMHNNKHTFAAKMRSSSNTTDANANANGHHHHHHHHQGGGGGYNGNSEDANNADSSSS